MTPPRSVCAEHPKFMRGCAGCRAASVAYRATRRAEVASGMWPHLLRGSALEPVEAHTRALLAIEGVSGVQVAERVGVSYHTIYRLRDGRQKFLHPDFAAAILGLRPERLRPRRTPTAQGWVDSIGAARRLQALMADGWRYEELAIICGVSRSEMGRWRRRTHAYVSVANHEKIAQLYDKIQSMADPRGSSRGAAGQARQLGYLLPECWADEDIDNPAAEPLPMPPETDDWVAVTLQVDAVLHGCEPGRGAHLERHLKREVARQAYHRLGWSYERIAEALGYRSPNAVEYLLWGRKDRPHTATRRVPK